MYIPLTLLYIRIYKKCSRHHLKSPCPASTGSSSTDDPEPMAGAWKVHQFGGGDTMGWIVSFKCGMAQTSLPIIWIHQDINHLPVHHFASIYLCVSYCTVHNQIKWDINFLGRNQRNLDHLPIHQSLKELFLCRRNQACNGHDVTIWLCPKRRIPKWVQIKGSFNCHTGPTLGSCLGRKFEEPMLEHGIFVALLCIFGMWWHRL